MQNHNRGFFRFFFLIIIIVVASYIGLDLRGFLEDAQTKDNVSFVWEWIVTFWNWIQPAVSFVWHEVLVQYVFEPLRSLIENRGAETGK